MELPRLCNMVRDLHPTIYPTYFNSEHLFTGYGGFTIPLNPYFSVFQLTFLQKYRGVLAVPNIRGGGEFGEDWHQGGIRERKVEFSLLLFSLTVTEWTTTIAAG